MDPESGNERFSKISRIGIVLILAVLFTAAFHQAVYLNYQKFRIRIANAVEAPESATILVDFRATPEQRNTFQILILRLNNTAAQNQSILIQLNSTFISRVDLPPKTRAKFDLHLPQNIEFKRDNKLKLKAVSASSWRLDRAEISNYYGAFKGLIQLLVLNRDSDYRRPTALASLMVFLALFLGGLFVVGRTIRLSLPRLYKVMLAIIALLLTTVLVLPFISKYRVVFSLFTFLIFAGITSFPLLPVLLTSRSGREARTTNRRVLYASLTVTAIFVFYLSSMLSSLETYGNFSAFLRLTERTVRRNPFLREQKELRKDLVTYESGYDGMFMYFISFDPFLSRFQGDEIQYGKFIDFPPYRFGRIGFPLLTKIFSLNRPALFPKTMMLLIVFSHLVAAFFLVRILLDSGRHPAWALLYLSVPAFCVSLELALPESIAAAFLLGASSLYIRDRPIGCALLLAASILVRETGAVFAIILILFELIRRGRSRAMYFCLALVPYGFWKLYLGLRLFDEYGVRAFTGGGDVWTVPFAGVIRLWGSIYSGASANPATASIFYSILILAIFAIAIVTLRLRKDPLTIGLFCYALIAISLNYRKVWLFLPNGERATYEAFLFLMLAFISTFEVQTRAIRIVYLILFASIFAYNMFFLSAATAFRAGFASILG